MTERDRTAGSESGSGSGAGTGPEGDGRVAEQSVGVTVPESHVGAFVAEAFEDPERSTTWTEVVDAAIAPSARDAWRALAPAEQVTELLSMADEFDERAVEALAAIPVDRGEPTERIDDLFAEARRCRRNADRLRDGIAAAYADGRIDDDALVAAVREHGFETGTVAERERLLEAVTDAYGYDFRPYGGTLMDETGGTDEGDATEPW